MALKVKVGLIGLLDMLKFKNLAKTREKAIQSAPSKEIIGEYAINANAKALHPDSMELMVCQVIDYPEADAKTYVLSPVQDISLPMFRAGQYISLKLPIGNSFVTRPYSISSSPTWTQEGMVDITVRANPGGFAADWLLNNLKEGDRVIASAPEGQFYYEPLRDAHHVIAVAGGSGITPFLSMAGAIRDGMEDFNLTILFGSRTKESILFHRELDDIAEKCPKVKVVHVLSDEKADGYEHGFINAELICKYAPQNEDYSVFICGPEAMYRFLENELPKLGLPRRRIRRELLGVTKSVWEQHGYPQSACGQRYHLTVKQAGREYHIAARAEETILVAIERAGIVAPSRCRSGECGWCRSKLISGDIFIPEENEGRRWADIQHGYIHPCSTFPLSDLVVEVPGEYTV